MNIDRLKPRGKWRKEGQKERKMVEKWRKDVKEAQRLLWCCWRNGDIGNKCWSWNNMWDMQYMCVYVQNEHQGENVSGSFSNVFTAHTNTRYQTQKGKWESKKMSWGNEGYKDGRGGGWGCSNFAAGNDGVITRENEERGKTQLHQLSLQSDLVYL